MQIIFKVKNKEVTATSLENAPLDQVALQGAYIRAYKQLVTSSWQESRSEEKLKAAVSELFPVLGVELAWQRLTIDLYDNDVEIDVPVLTAERVSVSG